MEQALLEMNEQLTIASENDIHDRNRDDHDHDCETYKNGIGIGMVGDSGDFSGAAIKATEFGNAKFLGTIEKMLEIICNFYVLSTVFILSWFYYFESRYFEYGKITSHFSLTYWIVDNKKYSDTNSLVVFSELLLSLIYVGLNWYFLVKLYDFKCVQIRYVNMYRKFTTMSGSIAMPSATDDDVYMRHSPRDGSNESRFVAVCNCSKKCDFSSTFIQYFTSLD